MLTEEKRNKLLQLSPALAVDAMDRLGLPESVLDPGDVIFADNDGVMIIDAAHLDAVIERAGEIGQWERDVHKMIASGSSFEAALASAGKMP